MKFVFYNIRQKWDGENVLLDSVKWLYDNSSEQFVLAAIEDFDDSDKLKIKLIENDLRREYGKEKVCRTFRNHGILFRRKRIPKE